jgi:hypothetical protein
MHRQRKPPLVTDSRFDSHSTPLIDPGLDNHQSGSPSLGQAIQQLQFAASLDKHLPGIMKTKERSSRAFGWAALDQRFPVWYLGIATVDLLL